MRATLTIIFVLLVWLLIVLGLGDLRDIISSTWRQMKREDKIDEFLKDLKD